MAKDAAILFVAGWVSRDLPQLEVVARVGGLHEHDPVLGRQALPHASEGGRGLSVAEADTRHDTHALGLYENLALLVRARVDQGTE